MESADFDKLVKRLSVIHWSRRSSFRTGVAGVAVVLATAGHSWSRSGLAGSATADVTTPAAGATPPAEAGEDGTWLCDQSYALCSTSPCEPTPWDPKIATCPCKVETGYSIGFKTCDERAPAGNTLISDFSTANITNSVRHLSCPERGVWANCLDMPCVITRDDPSRAICLCPLEESGDYVTFGGDCDVTTCSTVIWSAASSSGNVLPAFQAAMEQAGEDAIIPESCPTAATPVSATSG